MREIDRHLATCPMCSDVVEGLMLLSAPSVVVDDLNKKIDAKIAEKVAEITAEKHTETPTEMPVLAPVLSIVKRPFWQQRWAAAAAVVLLVSGSFFIYTNVQKVDKQAVADSESVVLPKSDTVENFNTPPQYAAAEAAKSGSNSMPPSALKNGDKYVSTTVTPSGMSSGEMEDVNMPFKDSMSNNQFDGVSEKKASKQQQPSAEVAVADNVAAKPSANVPTTTYSSAPEYDRTRDYAGASNMNSVPRPTTSIPMKAKDATTTTVEEKADNVKQSKSKEKLEEVVVTGTAKTKKQTTSTASKTPTPTAKPSAPPMETPSLSAASDLILSRANGYFKQKNYATAAAEYTQFLNNETSGDRHERALFQIATCYVNLNRKAEAKVIFEKLVAMKGTYERMAKKALKNL